MKSETRGTDTSEAEVTNISRHGIWVLVDDQEHFLAHEDFPWFKRAPISAILDVERPQPDHLRWPQIDVDLSLASIRDPRLFPLVAREAAEFGEQPFNREYVLYHLRESLQQAQRMIADLESDPDYDQPKFMVEMSHLYLHVNTAWNARTASAEKVENCSQDDFDLWRQYPDDLPMI